MKEKKDKQIEIILKILYTIRNDDEFYFISYGKALLEDLIKNDNKDKN